MVDFPTSDSTREYEDVYPRSPLAVYPGQSLPVIGFVSGGDCWTPLMRVYFSGSQIAQRFESI